MLPNWQKPQKEIAVGSGSFFHASHKDKNGEPRNVGFLSGAKIWRLKMMALDIVSVQKP